MLKTSESIESITRPGKGRVGVGGDGGDNSGHNDRGSHSGDSDKKFGFIGYVKSSHIVLRFRHSSDAPKLMCSPAPLTSMCNAMIKRPTNHMMLTNDHLHDLLT